MKEELSKARLKELYLPSTEDFVVVDVPELQYVMIDGKGRLEPDPYPGAVKWLFSVIHPLKVIAKERMGKDFVEPPLEGLWWADNMEDFICGNRDKLKWRMMIVTAHWVTQKMFKEAVASTKEKLGEVPRSLRLEYYDEGRSVQIMHIGPPGKAAATITRLHQEYLPAHNLAPNGHHHEIYLNDPNRVAAEKLKTVFRQPVLGVSK